VTAGSKQDFYSSP